MNSIKARLDNSDYEIYNDILNFRIDGFWLDEKLEKCYPGQMYKGLISTLLFVLDNEDEREVVWSRIMPKENTKTICPILMCPDDCDFFCTLIVVEIEVSSGKVRWNKIGVDQTKVFDPEKIGSEVIWLEKIKPFEFIKTEYIEMVNEFRTQFAIDNDRWQLNR